MKFQIAMRTIAIPRKIAMMNSAIAMITALMAEAIAEMMLPILFVLWGLDRDQHGTLRVKMGSGAGSGITVTTM
ncbi:hypothetical protein BCR39DRAFT_528756 [Naematelia encephala]|uniref:Uncharacterized protein n=1 Tax=Naematelia encephala TaxID=71784 RepID=A0A1Y2B762_9TREE|nr:hypothetical protein BCR39DRAFT_528756 [Naematelia encephala]